MSSTPHSDPADVPAPRVPETGAPETGPTGTGPFDAEVPGAAATGPEGTASVPEDLETEAPATSPSNGSGASHQGDREADLKPLYAVAGLTDLVVGAVRSTLVDTQHWASARLAEMRFRQAELEKQAAEMRERADDLGDQVRTLPETTRGRVGELQQQANHTYAELAGRGQRVVQTVADRVDPVFDRLQESIAAARRRVTGRSPGDAPAPGRTDIIVVEETLEPGDDLTSTPSGVPDEALVAEETILVGGDVPGDEREDDLGATDLDDDGDTTTQR